MSVKAPQTSPPPAAKAAPDKDWSALMAAAQDGDAKAYGELLGAITPYLRVVARRAGLGAEEIEDGVQDILLDHPFDPPEL